MATTINFFQAQDAARGRTAKLILLLTLAAALVIFSPFIVIMAVWSFVVPHVSWYQPELLLFISIPMLLIVLIGSSIRMGELADGGGAIAGRLGASLVSAQTTIPAERAYLNIVEEMALASGLPVPCCYVFSGDQTINAFAAANGPDDAAIAVTQGALVNLTRDELQGVVAYVMGHIGNGDTKLSVRFIGVAGGLSALDECGNFAIKAGTGLARMLGFAEDVPSGCLPVVAPVLTVVGGLVLLLFVTGGIVMIIGATGPPLIYAIQAAVWRQREALSDAAAVQFTRNPAGLASALKKVVQRGSVVGSMASKDRSWQNFFFAPHRGDVLDTGSLRSAISTRIKLIDPTFDGVIRALSPSSATGGVIAADRQILAAFGFGGVLPPDLRTAAAEPVGAMGIVLGLILRQDPALRTQQLAQAQGLAGGEVVKEALKHEAMLRALPAGHRVPLLDVAMPALRQLSAAQVAEFGQAIDQVGCQADDGLVVLLIHSSMRRYLSVATKRVGNAGDLDASCALILSAVVQTSGEGADAQAAAYLKGAKALGMKRVSLVMLPAEQVDLAEVESALGVIADKSVIDLLRRKLVNACCVAMLSDGKAEPAEVEIIRAVADSLGVILSTGAKA